MTPRIEHKTENSIELKRCGKCEAWHPLTNYNASSTTWDKLRQTCKTCLHEERMKNKEKMTEYNKQYWQKTKEEQTEKHREWKAKNQEHCQAYMKQWRVEHIEELKLKDKEYRETHREQRRLTLNAWKKKDLEDLKTNPDRAHEYAHYKVKTNTARRIRDLLGAVGGKAARTHDIIGCTVTHLKAHLESKFTEGMTWENYGTSPDGSFRDAWHIDHIVPCAAFDLTDNAELLACFNWRNLQPLWAADNIKKKDETSAEAKAVYMQSLAQ
jgi:hypothetical protein